MCDLSRSHYILIMIDAVHVLEVRAWIYTQKNDFGFDPHLGLRNRFSEYGA